MSKYGIKIKNIHAGILYETNLGIREYFTYTDALFHNSLFSFYLQKNGLQVSPKGSTRDLICLDFNFGSPSYEDEMQKLQKMLQSASSDEEKNRLENAILKVTSKKGLFAPKTRSEIREDFYNHGVDVTYKTPMEETIHYEMLYRTSAKAKEGQVIFINSRLYEKAYEWLTMGLGRKLAKDNAKIVELSAYAPLTTSTIVDTIYIPIEDILILEDQKSAFWTMANVVKTAPCTDKNKNTRKKCIVTKEKYEVHNTLWDGMGIIESDILPDWVNGMALLRNHLFKMCGMRGHIQKFFKDWCEKNHKDYASYQIQDMFGHWHYVKDIKVITTDNAIKWKKFADLMGDSPETAYTYWCEHIQKDGSLWGIVKTDHPSKFGQYQQLSYQMINTLPCKKEDIGQIAKTSIEYVNLLKRDNAAFEKYLRKYATKVNHYEMLADLYRQNPRFGDCKWFREEKRKIIHHYVSHLRKGKILVNGDNLTVFGNPYALLLYAAGEDWKKDFTLQKEPGAIQCYTPRFSANTYLAAFRNPHNSPNNICYMHNVYHEIWDTYFDFSPNIVAINCIETDIQDRANGMDEDSDFMLFTDEPTIVQCAKESYAHYPTIVNALQESHITYCNTKSAYAFMDNRFSGSKTGIGWASNLAQLAMTYYWTEKAKPLPDETHLQELYDNFIILSVVAQIIIDGCKREYEISGVEEIKRISKLSCMTLTDKNGRKCDLPVFMKYTRNMHTDISRKRIHPDLQCPMNWLEEYLDKIPGASTHNTLPTENFFIKIQGSANRRQISKIQKLVMEFDAKVKHLQCIKPDDDNLYIEKLIAYTDEILENLSKIQIGNPVTINRLIETALGLEKNHNQRYYKHYESKYTRKLLNCLYRMDKERFLANFKS